MMQNLMLHNFKRTKGARASLLASYIQESRKADLITLTDKMVNQFYASWGNDELGELPLSFRHDIVRLARPKEFMMHE